MIVYHGTSTLAVPHILREGILTTDEVRERGREAIWGISNGIALTPDLALAADYAHFAEHLVRAYDDPDRSPYGVILRIDASGLQLTEDPIGDHPEGASLVGSETIPRARILGLSWDEGATFQSPL